MKPQVSAAYRGRVATLVMSSVLVLLLLGCLSPIILPEHTKKCDDDVICQNGEVHLMPGEQDVYYPLPFASTPNLELRNPMFVQLIDQKPDHFRISCPNSMLGSMSLEWKARGLRGQPVVAATVEAPAHQVEAASEHE